MISQLYPKTSNGGQAMIMPLILLWSVLACSGQHSERVEPNKAVEAKGDPHDVTLNSSDIACQILAGFPQSLARTDKGIKGRPSWMNGKDSCVIALIDSIAAHMRSEESPDYMRHFAIVSRYGDGYISEYVSEINVEFFKTNLYRIIRYLRNESDTVTATTLRERIIQDIKNEMTYNPRQFSSGILAQSMSEAMSSAKDGTDSALINDLNAEILATKK